VVALWAALYLPGLGAIELKGEEGRRVLPAVTMIETRDWIVPFIGGEPYLRKPPLIHWVVAAAFRITGHRDEWAARIPSALSVLLLAATLIIVGGKWLSPSTALVGAICATTNLAMLEKGRLCELEALYTAMTGIAIICWVTWWREERSKWLIWTAPFISLAFGLLTKGPLHLLFFYAVVVAILHKGKRLRDLWTLPHLVGVLLMLGIAALWAVPYLQRATQLNVGNVWTQEFAGRVTHSQISLELWLENLWNNFRNFLPWLLFAPLWWNRKVVASLRERDAAIFAGLRFAVVLCGCGLILIPGFLSRYTIPLVVPASMLIALALRSPELLPSRVLSIWRIGLIILCAAAVISALALPWLLGLQAAGAAVCVILSGVALLALLRRRFTHPLPLAVGTACAIALGSIVFVTAQIPRVIAAERSRPIGKRINAALPGVHELYVINSGFQPAHFYLQQKLIYLRSPRDLPPQQLFVLLPSSANTKLATFGRASRLLDQFKDAGDREFLLIELSAAPG